MNMKKLLATVLAMALVLAAAGAYAAEYAANSRSALTQLFDRNNENGAKNGDIVKLSDITHEGAWAAVNVPDGVIIDGNGSTLTINADNTRPGNCLFNGGNYSIKNLKIVYNNSQTVPIGVEINGGVVENVTIEGDIKHGIYSGNNDTTVKNCTFDTTLYGIYTEAADGFGEVTGNTFNSPRAMVLWGDETFSGNTVNGDKGLSVATANATITSNTFTGTRALSVSKGGADITNNKILNNAKVEVSGESKVDLTDNYWGPNGPAKDQLVVEDAKAEITINGWFTDAGMKNFFDPNAPVVGGGAADMPSTGDGSMLMLWAALLALCGAGMAAMKRAKA